MSNRGGPAVAVRSWARHDLRARWRGLVVLAVIAGLAGGFAIALFDGARRTGTAFDRLRSETNGADAVVFTSQVNEPHPGAKWTEFARQPEVEQLARWYLAFGSINGNNDPDNVLFGSVDGTWLGSVDRPKVIAGRMFDPHSDAEAVISEPVVKSDHVHLGDTITYRSYSEAQSEEQNPGPPQGASLRFRVVGIVRTVQQFLFTPMVMLPQGVVEKHPHDVAWIENGWVRLRSHNPAAVEQLQEDANRILAKGTPILDMHVAQRRIDTTTSVERTALLLIAIAVAAAGFVLVAQVIGRSAATVAEDAPVLRAFGLRRREVTAAGVLPHVAVAAGAAMIAVITAIVASRWFPVGLAAQVDPDRGFRADWLVVLPGAVLIAGFVVASATLVASRAAQPLRVANSRSNRFVGWFRRSAPVSVGIGTAMVLEPRTRRRDISARPAVIAAIVGVVGVVATLTINQGLQESLRHPERAGVTYQALLTPNEHNLHDGVATPAFLDAARHVDGVAAAEPIARALVPVDKVGVPAYTLDGDDIGFTIIKGEPPRAPDEIAIGPSTAHDLHVGIGDRVKVGDDGVPMKITGQALFPDEVHATFDQGVWIPPSVWKRVVGPVGPEEIEAGVAVRLASGVDLEAGLTRMQHTLGDRIDGVTGATTPQELTNLHYVRSLPAVLAAFLALLALAALSYVLLATTRARTRDFAVLRAIGFVRGQSRAVVGAQGATVAVIGLIAGVPIGVLAGRTAWSLITERVPLQDVPPVAVAAVVAFVPLALLAAGLTVLWPARRVNRIRPAVALRTE